MLKWLKKPGDLGETGQNHRQNQQVKKIVTDDPLAAALRSQIHQHQQVNEKKKSKTKNNANFEQSPRVQSKKSKKLQANNEIYAVTRVNPLFETDDGENGIREIGKSGSSGYDSSSGSPSDEELAKNPTKLPENLPTSSTVSPISSKTSSSTPSPTSSTSSSPSTSSSSRLTRVVLLPKPPSLFRDLSEDTVFHQQVDVGDGGSGNAILNILEQNPHFVRSISVKVPENSNINSNNANFSRLSPIEESRSVKIFRPKGTNVNLAKSSNRLQVPTRDDSLGVAKILSKNSKFVQSIRITSKPPKFPQKSSNSNLVAKQLSKKPSVTFSEKVDVVGTGLRRFSGEIEADSLVTESLLLMTTPPPPPVKQQNAKKMQIKRVFVETHNPTAVVVSGKKSSKNPNKNTQEIHYVLHDGEILKDLQKFSNTLRINRPIKQFYRQKSPFDGGQQNVDDGIYDEAHDEESTDTSSSSISPQKQGSRSRSWGRVDWTSVGGIADVYAAASDHENELQVEAPSDYALKSKKKLIRELRIDIDDGDGPLNGPSNGPPVDEVIVGPKCVKDRSQDQDQQTRHQQPHLHEHVQSPRITKEIHLDLVGGSSNRIISSTSSESGLSSRSSSGGSSSGSSKKVMIVSGDRESVVIDLSAIPAELREAILKGSALINLPSHKNKNKNSSSSSKNSSQNSSQILSPSCSSSSGASSPAGSGSASPATAQKQNHHVHVHGGPPGNHGLDKGLIPPGEHIIVTIPPPPPPKNKEPPQNNGDNKIQNVENKEDLLQDHLVDNKDQGARNKTHFWDMQSKSSKNAKKGKFSHLSYHPNHGAHFGSPDFTLEGSKLAKQNAKVRISKKRRCFCRIFGMLFFVLAFLGVLVALSMIYTRGQKYFGSI